MESLKILRKLKNTKQSDIADCLGISAQAYGHYESGRRQPNPDTIIKLADYFGVTTDCLLGYKFDLSTTNIDGLTKEDVKILQLIIKLMKSKNG